VKKSLCNVFHAEAFALEVEKRFRRADVPEDFDCLTRVLGSYRVHSRHSESGIGIGDYRSSDARRKELVAGCVPDHSRPNSNLSQLAHINKLLEIWPELWVVAETLAVIEDLIFGRCAPDSGHDELPVGVYRVRSWHDCSPSELPSEEKPHRRK
jgi:hypothetical protein